MAYHNLHNNPDTQTMAPLTLPSLPREIRLQIYDYLLPTTIHDYDSNTKEDLRTTYAYRLICRQFKGEYERVAKHAMAT